MTAIDETISLTDAAERLGVHYMTAYRYVRTGRLFAAKVDGQWQVTDKDLSDFESNASAPAPRRGEVIPQRLVDRLVAGDENGAFLLLEGAMASGAGAEEIYLDLISPAMVEIGARWHREELSIADEHLASATAIRLISRLGPRITSRGRTKASVLLAAVSDDYHQLPTAIMRDLLRGRGYDAIDLGANAPPDSIVERAKSMDDLVAIGLASTAPGNDQKVSVTLSSISDTLDTPVLLGGSAFRDEEHIASLGECIPSRSARQALDLIDSIHASSLHS